MTNKADRLLKEAGLHQDDIDYLLNQSEAYIELDDGGEYLNGDTLVGDGAIAGLKVMLKNNKEDTQAENKDK